MTIRFRDFIDEAKIRFRDDIVVPKHDAPIVKTPSYMKSFSSVPSSTGTPARKDLSTGYTFTGHFVDQAFDRDLTEDEFKHLYKEILKTEREWKSQAKREDQRYMFTSKSRKRSWILRLLNGRISIITCLPKFRDGNDDYPDTIKRLIESNMMEGFIPIELT